MRPVMDRHKIKAICRQQKLLKATWLLSDVASMARVLDKVSVVASCLVTDPNYSKQDAAEDLLELARYLASEEIGTRNF